MQCHIREMNFPDSSLWPCPVVIVNKMSLHPFGTCRGLTQRQQHTNKQKVHTHCQNTTSTLNGLSLSPRYGSDSHWLFFIQNLLKIKEKVMGRDGICHVSGFAFPTLPIFSNSLFIPFSGPRVFFVWPLPHQSSRNVFTKPVPLFNFQFML